MKVCDIVADHGKATKNIGAKMKTTVDAALGDKALKKASIYSS
jgi:hypothetical protein